MDKRLERILPRVQKPARYVGGEFNAIMKDKSKVDTRVAFCFPDTYEIGMSNLGMRILYGVMNNIEGVWCERCFAPWGDMEQEMRNANIPLYALESFDPIKDFDIIAFSIGYEMAFPAMVDMLDLAGVPLHASERTALTPLVVAGGTAMYNCEPIADFIDLALIGEGEEMDVELIELHRQARREGWSKHEFLVCAAQIPGVYVPSLYDVVYNDDGTVKSITANEGAPKVVLKRIMRDMDKAYYPTKTIVPSTEIVQDRVSLELFRGCIRGCRFCQAGYVYRPVRNRSEELLRGYAVEAVEDSGYQDMTLSSLSTSDYPHLVELCDDLEDFCAQRHVTLALPSLRADNFSMALMERLQKGRKTGLTFAPEAGTQRLRDAINKNLTEEDLLESCRRAFAGGYSAVKLYFMLGLPTETDEDVLGIADIAAHVMHAWRESALNKTRGVRITVSTSWFVPKPHTAFQWEPQIPIEEYERRVKLLGAHAHQLDRHARGGPPHIEQTQRRRARLLPLHKEEAERRQARALIVSGRGHQPRRLGAALGIALGVRRAERAARRAEVLPALGRVADAVGHTAGRRRRRHAELFGERRAVDGKVKGTAQLRVGEGVGQMVVEHTDRLRQRSGLPRLILRQLLDGRVGQLRGVVQLAGKKLIVVRLRVRLEAEANAVRHDELALVVFAVSLRLKLRGLYPCAHGIGAVRHDVGGRRPTRIPLHQITAQRGRRRRRADAGDEVGAGPAERHEEGALSLGLHAEQRHVAALAHLVIARDHAQKRGVG